MGNFMANFMMILVSWELNQFKEYWTKETRSYIFQLFEIDLVLIPLWSYLYKRNSSVEFIHLEICTFFML